MTETNMYKSMEPYLQILNKDYIKLSDEEVTRNNIILHRLLDLIIDHMRNTDPLFDKLCIGLYYGGSYFDGLKIERPDEFDVDVLFKLPKELEFNFTESNRPGSVSIMINNVKYIKRGWRTVPYYGISYLNALVNSDHYLSSEKFLLWFHRILSVALKPYKVCKQKYVLELETGYGTFIQVRIRRRGPAFIIRVCEEDGEFMYVDFVPSFKFDEEYWLPNGFVNHENIFYAKKTFFIIPKNAPIGTPLLNSRYWRMSFQEQEREIINGKKNFKPAIKLLKRMKIKYNHNCIASYYLKTIGLWQIEKQPADFWDNRLGYVFMMLLKEYRENLKRDTIKYFWYPKKNLIDNVDVTDIYSKIDKIIKDIDKNPDIGIIVAKYILTKREFKAFKEDYL